MISLQPADLAKPPPNQADKNDALRIPQTAWHRRPPFSNGPGSAVDRVPQNVVFEKPFRAAIAYRDPFSDADFNVRITFPDGAENIYPGFWTGGDTFTFRFYSHQVGTFAYATLASDERDRGLHDRRGTFQVTKYDGDNPLLRHVPHEETLAVRHGPLGHAAGDVVPRRRPSRCACSRPTRGHHNRPDACPQATHRSGHRAAIST